MSGIKRFCAGGTTDVCGHNRGPYDSTLRLAKSDARQSPNHPNYLLCAMRYIS
jgi:hypothetical protein